LLVLAVVANLVLSAAFLRVLLIRYGCVGRVEMQAVVAAATLVNYLPLRPGLFARVAYHRAVNDIRARDTAKTVVQAAIISSGIAMSLAIGCSVAMSVDLPLWIVVVPPIPALAAGLLRADWRPWCLAILIRYVEILVWSVRYHAAFVLLGAPIDPTAALAFACVGAIANLVPFVSNGLGLREWAVGLLAPALAGTTLEIGVTAELVNRAVEMIVVGAAGLVAMIWLSRRRAAAAGRETSRSVSGSSSTPPARPPGPGS